MQVISCRYSGASDSSDVPSHADTITLSDIHPAQMRIQCGETSPMAYLDIPTVTAAVSGFSHLSATRCINGGSVRNCYIHTCMDDPSFFHRMHPHAETGRDGSPPMPPVKGEQNRIVGEYRYRHPALPNKSLSGLG